MGWLNSGSMRAMSPADDRWYLPYAGTSDAGIPVDAQTVLYCGTVLAAVRFKAQSFGLCPPNVYIEKPGNIREEDRAHYLFRTLRRPNRGQTGFAWRMHTAYNMILHGNAYNRIVGGRRSWVEALHPLEPERVKILQRRRDIIGPGPAPSAFDGDLVYEYTPPYGVGAPEKLAQGEVLHFRELSQNGYSGLVTYQLLRNIVGIAMSAELHASRFLKKGARIAGIITPKGTLAETVRKAAEDGIRKAWGGADAEGSIALLGAEFDFKPVTLDHQKSQFLELRDHQVEEILRALGVPGVVVGYSKNLMGYASADAFFEKGGIKHCLLPLVENIQEEIDYALLVDADQHYCKFSLDTLLRASTENVWKLLIQASGGPIISTNEARRIVDLNPDPDPESNKIARPLNMGTPQEPDEPDEPAPAPPRVLPKPAPVDDDADQARRTHHEQLVANAAARVIRRELVEIRGGRGTKGAAERLAAKPAAWRAWAEKFYIDHAAFVSRELGVSATIAAAYCESQRAALLADLAVVEGWEESRIPLLVAMAFADPWQEMMEAST